MKKIIFIIIPLLFFSCNNQEQIILVKKDSTSDISIKKNKKQKDVTTDIEDSEDAKYKLSPDEYAYLFFNKTYFISSNKRDIIPKIIYNENDFKIIIEWQVLGNRFIKLKDLKNQKEYIINEGNKTGTVILVKRDLLFCTFKIDNQIIKVRR